MTKALSIMTLALLIAAPAAHAEMLGVNVNAQANVHANVQNQDRDRDMDEATTSTTTERENHATSTGAQKHASTTVNATAEAHRSEVANFVHSLLSVADRDGGIGAEVRQVAQSQNDSASTTVEAMTKLEMRSKLATFLVGTDWKALGTLRSESAKASADIDHLKTLLNQASSTEVRADLQADIDALTQAKADIDAFISAHESSFSLFGWFTKLFAK
ncbi:MAG: hypothetical protein ACM3TU_02265 [Bacillota bacterium]